MHSYLFKDNLIQLLNKDVNVVPLMNSNILMMQFSNEEWPQVHANDMKVIRPYNGSFFHLNNSYNELFFNALETKKAQKNTLGTQSKIKY